MKQQTLADGGFEKYRKKTRKGQFLNEMDAIIAWKQLTKVIEPFYQNPQGAGRHPIGIEKMLRTHFLQHWFNLSDPAVVESLYDLDIWGRSKNFPNSTSASISSGTDAVHPALRSAA